MYMLNSYDQRMCERFPTRKKSHFFNSHFMERLMETKKRYDYNEVVKWTKNINVFELDKILFPINYKNSHWTLACVYIEKKEIHYFDSYIEKGNSHGHRYTDKSVYYMSGLIQWIMDEGMNKHKPQREVEWKLINQSKICPQQENDLDCGVFTIVCADYLTDDLLLQYSQNDMQFWREKIGIDILRGQLRY